VRPPFSARKTRRVDFSTVPCPGPGPTLDLVRSCMASGLVCRRTFVECWASGLGVVSTLRVVSARGTTAAIGGDEADQPCRPA
jgi:hypothetical protein